MSKSQNRTVHTRVYSSLPRNHEQFRLGAVRETFNKNEPILKQNPRLARVHRRGFDLPKSKSFVYGHKNYYEDGGVASAIKHDLEFKHEIKVSEMPRDFISLNKHSVTSGITNVRDQKQYRMLHDIRLRPEPTNSYGKPLVLPHDYTAGMSNRPSTPVDKLIKFKYQEKWIKDMISSQENDTKFQMSQTTLQTGKAFENKASTLRKNRDLKKHYHPTGLKKEGSYLWKIEKFNNVPSKIASFRTEKAMEKAYNKHTLHKDMGSLVA